jgi:hypothetical protein
MTANHSAQENCASTISFKARFEAVLEDAAPFLQNKLLCRTLQNHLERLALALHIGYAICRMCRLVLDESSGLGHSNLDSDGNVVDDTSSMREFLATGCAWRASKVVESFLDMHRFSSQVCRSWAFVHNVVSCAMTLKHLEESGLRKEGESEKLVKSLIAVLEKEEARSEWFDEDGNRRCPGPYPRALKALKATYGVEAGEGGSTFDPQFQ